LEDAIGLAKSDVVREDLIFSELQQGTLDAWKKSTRSRL
jgi:hypothetical protein